MSDFERAAARLRRASQSDRSFGRSILSRDAVEPEDSNESLDSFRILLRQKLNEPLDVLLQDDEVPFVSSDTTLIADNGRTGDAAVIPVAGVELVGQSDASPKVNIVDRDIVDGNLDDQDTGEIERSANYEASSFRKLETSFSSLAERGFITPGTSKGQLTEEYRRIKRPLLKRMKGSAPESQLNVIMVTSSIQGEGKTYSSINLAVSLAQEKNWSVLLIDADVVKATAGRELGAKGDEAGLLDLLAETYRQPSEVIMNTNIPNLTFMPAGKADDNANELLTSARMRHIVNELARESTERIVILDCPPILQTNEANVLADYAGQIVFVVAEQQTSQSLVQEALNYLEKDKFVGMLLNKSSRVGAGYGYGNGYY